MKIHFCDVCNESVPQKDLEQGRAVLRKGRVVCAACEGAMTPQAEPAPIEEAAVGEDTTIVETRLPPTVRPPRGSSGAVLGVAFASVALVFSVGVGAWVLEELDAQRAGFAELVSAERTARTRGEAALNREVRQALRESNTGLQELRTSLTEVAARLEAEEGTDSRASETVLRELGRIDEKLAQLDALSRRIDANEDQLERALETTADLHDDVLRLGQRAGSEIPPAAEADADSSGLPLSFDPEWFEILPDLASENPGTRWKAVQALGDTRDPAVAEHLVDMLRDSDIFVRMATARILGDLGAVVGIPALIDTLEDSEASVREAAVVALRSITGRSFRFDPGAKELERKRHVEEWRDWWKKSADKFLERT